jgi:hypothetical protein
MPDKWHTTSETAAVRAVTNARKGADVAAFARGRFVLIGQGAVLLVLAVWALIGGPDVLVFHLTPVSTLLLGLTGAASVVCAADRHAGRIFAIVQAVGYLLLFVFASAAESAARPPVGFTAADTFLFMALSILGVVLVLWLYARAMSDPSWQGPSKK